MLTIALNKLLPVFKHRFLDSSDTVLRLDRHRCAMNIAPRKREGKERCIFEIGIIIRSAFDKSN